MNSTTSKERARKSPVTAQGSFLPALPQAVVKLLEVTLDDEASLSAVTNLAEKDPGLTTQILRLANSPLFGINRNVATMDQAVVSLGMGMVRNIAVSLSIYEAFSDLDRLEGFSLAKFWHHSISVSIIAKHLAALCDYEEPEEAFIAGLLHDVGQLHMIKISPDNFKKIVEAAQSGTTVLAAERKYWGKDHAQAGAELLQAYHFPPAIVDAVCYHHHPEEEIVHSLSLVRIIYIANRLAHQADESSAIVPAALEDLAKKLLSIEREQLHQILASLAKDVREAADILGISAPEPSEKSVKISLAYQEKETASAIKQNAYDLGMTVGALETLISSKNEEELTDALFSTIALLLNVDSLFLLKHSGNGSFHGVKAKGTKHDGLATRIKLAAIPGSIWNQAFDRKQILHSDLYFSDRHPKVIDKQITTYLGGPFLTIPLSFGRNPFGIVLAKIDWLDWEEAKQWENLLKLLARNFSLAMSNYDLKELNVQVQALNTAILETAPVGLALVDPHGAIHFTNPAAQKIFESLGQEDLKRANLFEILHFNKDEEENFLKRTLDGRPLILQKKIPVEHKEQAFLWLDITITPIKGYEPLRILVTIQDVTVKKLFEMERSKRAELLSAALDQKAHEFQKAQESIVEAGRLAAASQFARKVAHEVNNPLSVIKNFLQILKMDVKDKEEALDALAATEKEIDRIAKIMEELREFAKQLAPEKAEVRGNINQVISDLIALWQKTLANKGIELQVEIDSDLPDVQISNENLKQILINLVKNAEEALAGPGKILVKCYQSDKEPKFVIIQVKDTGPGLSKEVKDHVFEPFVSSKGGENSGLGLSVCHGLLKAVGGSIEYKTEKGWGAVFEIRLPKV